MLDSYIYLDIAVRYLRFICVRRLIIFQMYFKVGHIIVPICELSGHRIACLLCRCMLGVHHGGVSDALRGCSAMVELKRWVPHTAVYERYILMYDIHVTLVSLCLHDVFKCHNLQWA